jgi:hypothetical protein
VLISQPNNLYTKELLQVISSSNSVFFLKHINCFSCSGEVLLIICYNDVVHIKEEEDSIFNYTV